MSLIVFGVALSWLIVGLGCWLGFQLLRQSGRILLRLEELEQRLALPGQAPPVEPPDPPGLPVGSPAPEFELPDLKGERRSLAQFRGRKVLLVFFNPGCGFCVQMAADLAALPTDGRGGHPVPLVVSGGTAEENQKLVEEYGIRCPVLFQQGTEIAALYQAYGTPVGCLIDEEGQIASELAMGAEALLALARQPANGNGHMAISGTRSLADSKIQRNGLAAGTLAPSFTLAHPDGGELSLDEYRGRKVLLVFSDPNCGPCDVLAPQLEREHRASSGVQVLMVSRGDPEINRAKAEQHGLTFPIGLQRQWEVSRQYAIFATPVGYLIDETGIVVADVAQGVDPILALLSRAGARAEAGANEQRCQCGRPLGSCGCGKRQASAAKRNGR